MTNWIPTLIFIAALALLPAWLVGAAALGAAAGLWYVSALRRYRKQTEEVHQKPTPPDSSKIISLQAARLRKKGGWL